MAKLESPTPALSEEALKTASFGESSHRWQFSYCPVEELDLYRLCHVDSPVMHWAPRRAEVERFAEFVIGLHGDKPGNPTLLEIGSGSGLLSYLLASTGKLDVIALDPDPRFSASTIYRHPRLNHVVADAAQAIDLFRGQEITCALNSWMPPQINLTPAIRTLGTAGIIYILEERGETGVPETYAQSLSWRHGKDKLDDLVSYRPGKSHKRACEWHGPAQWEITEWPKGHFYSESMRDTNKIDIQARVDLPREIVERAVARVTAVDASALPRYPWEAKLEQYKGPEPGKVTPLL